MTPCCDIHNAHCEPPSELCCYDCTEAAHPEHPPGVRCVLNPSERISVIDLKQGTLVKLLGQIYEIERVERTFANERNVVLRQIGGSNRLELAELEHPFAVFEPAAFVGES